MRKDMNAALKFVEDNLAGILAEYDEEDLEKTDGRTIVNELTEEFDSILTARIEDSDMIDMAKSLGKNMGDRDAKRIADANDARFYVLAEITRILSKKFSACDKKGTRDAV